MAAPTEDGEPVESTEGLPDLGGGGSGVRPRKPAVAGGGGGGGVRAGVLVALLTGAVAGAGGTRGLQLGSADPHMLREAGAVQEPWERTRGAFSMDHLDPAEEGELARRAFPNLNEAPRTDPREAPTLAFVGPAPLVRELHDVVPAGTQRQVADWVRQLKDCLRAAGRGNLKMARELRPGDLVLRADEGHMVPGTEHWVWDLRPLALGLPAVPLAMSGEGRPPPTDLLLSAVLAQSVGFLDEEIISEMVHGVSDDAACEAVAVLSPPHVGALQYYAELQAKLAKDRGRGWSHSAGWAMPFWPVRANAYSVVEEERGVVKKHRMTIDLSWPRPEAGLGVESVNSAIDRSAWPVVRMVRAAQLAESAAILQTAGVSVLVWSFDCEAYYRKVGRQQGEIWRNCYVVGDGWVVDEREQFGDASAAVKCCRMSNYLAWLVKRAMRAVDEMYPTRDPAVLAWLRERPEVEGASSLGFFGLYVDDGAGGSIDDLLFDVAGAPMLMPCGRHCRRAEMHFAAACAAVEGIGHLSEPTKEQSPREVLEVLGVEIDLVERRLRLTPGKRERYAARAEQVAGRAADEAGLVVCGLKEFEGVLHRLLFAACCFPQGRQWLHCMFRVARANFRLKGGKVGVSEKVRRALRRWVAELRSEGHEGVPLASRGAFPMAGAPGVGVAYSDASGEYGFGAWALQGRRVLYVEGQWTQAEREGMHINLKELFAMAVSLGTFLPIMGSRWVAEFTDNTAAEGAARRLSPRTAAMQRLVERRVDLLRSCGAFSAVARVATGENKWADLLSRAGGLAEFLSQVEALGLTAVPCSVPAEWRDTTELVEGVSL